MIKIALCAALALLLAPACASQSYSARVDYVGRYRDAQAVNEAAAAITDEEASEVPVLLNELPPGVTLSDGKVNIAPEAPWVLVAQASADPNGGRSYWWMGFYDYNEDESWRKGLCYPQVPLHWLTLGIWYIVPTDYACNVSESHSVESANNRKRRVIRTLQRAAKATGSDLVVLTGERRTSLVRAGTGAVLSTLEWDGGTGYLFKKK